MVRTLWVSECIVSILWALILNLLHSRSRLRSIWSCHYKSFLCKSLWFWKLFSACNPTLARTWRWCCHRITIVLGSISLFREYFISFSTIVLGSIIISIFNIFLWCLLIHFFAKSRFHCKWWLCSSFGFTKRAFKITHV